MFMFSTASALVTYSFLTRQRTRQPNQTASAGLHQLKLGAGRLLLTGKSGAFTLVLGWKPSENGFDR